VRLSLPYKLLRRETRALAQLERLLEKLVDLLVLLLALGTRVRVYEHRRRLRLPDVRLNIHDEPIRMRGAVVRVQAAPLLEDLLCAQQLHEREPPRVLVLWHDAVAPVHLCEGDVILQQLAQLIERRWHLSERELRR